MYVEMIWARKIITDRSFLLKKLKKDFVSFETKLLDKGNILIYGDNKLISNGGKYWNAFVPPNEKEDIVYFEVGISDDWIITPVLNAMRKNKSRVFTGVDINKIISDVICSIKKWEPKIKEEDVNEKK